MQAAQRHGVPLAGRAAAALPARPAQRARAEERALLVARLRPLRAQHAGHAAQRVQRSHTRAPSPPAPGHHLNLAGAAARLRACPARPRAQARDHPAPRPQRTIRTVHSDRDYERASTPAHRAFNTLLYTNLNATYKCKLTINCID